MDVKCPKCGTEYELEVEQIPPEGAIIQCATCSHQFGVERPKPVSAPPPLQPPSYTPPPESPPLQSAPVPHDSRSSAPLPPLPPPSAPSPTPQPERASNPPLPVDETIKKKEPSVEFPLPSEPEPPAPRIELQVTQPPLEEGATLETDEGKPLDLASVDEWEKKQSSKFIPIIIALAVVVIIVLAYVFISGGGTGLPEEDEKNLAQAKTLIKFNCEAKFLSAEKTLDELLKKYPERPEVLAAKAELLLARADHLSAKVEELESGVKEMSLAINTKGTSAELSEELNKRKEKYNQSASELKARQEEALSLLKKAITKDPENFSANIQYAELNRQLNNVDDANKAIQMAEKSRPNDKMLSFQKALMQFKTAPADFVTQVKPLFDSDNGFGKAGYYLARALIKTEKGEEAYKTLEKLLAAIPEHTPARELLSTLPKPKEEEAKEVEKEEAKIEKPKEEVKARKEEAPPPPPKKGQKTAKSARAPAEPPAKKTTDGGDCKSFIAKGDADLDNDNLDSAIKNYKKAVSLCPGNPQPYLGLAESYQFKGDKANAKVHYQKIIEKFPGTSQARIAKNALSRLQ